MASLARPRWPFLAAMVVVIVVAELPVTTSIGVDYVVTTRRIPLYEKVIAFVTRDAELRSVAERAVGDSVGDEARAAPTGLDPDARGPPTARPPGRR